MPTYEYECQKCGLRFERSQSIKAKPLKTCPDCGGAVHRLIGTGAAVVFKRSGSGSTEYGKSATRCGRDKPCCGRDTPCEAPPCDE